MVEPLNTKDGKIEAQPLHALPMPGTMPVSGSPDLPAVDGGERDWRVYHDWEEPSGQDFYIGPANNGSLDKAIAVRLSKENATLITTQQQEIERLTKEREALTYSSTQSTRCACGNVKHTPLRRDDMNGYVCLTCIDKELTTRRERIEAAESRVQSLEEEVKVLREALKPFAEYAPYVDMFVKGRAAQGGAPLLPTKHFRLNHFQAASAALKDNGQ